MKYLSREAFDRARAFLHSQARPLDRARFAYRFEDGPAEAVLAELKPFQNRDGGFGNALEPDLRTPTSSALATGIGLHILHCLGCSARHEMVQPAVDYLLNTFEPQSMTWRVAPQDTNAYPHAPWWHDEEGSLTRTFDDFLVIPRAELVSLLYIYADRVPAGWLEEVTEATVVAIEGLETEKFGGGGDTLRYALTLAETEGLPPSYRERMLPRLRRIAQEIVCREPEQWGGYCPTPLKIAPSPRSPVADLLEDSLQPHLDYQIEHQAADGSWEPVWTWGDMYPGIWEVARQEWQGILTLDNLASLRAFGRIEEEG
jgi:hypothetical protein